MDRNTIIGFILIAIILIVYSIYNARELEKQRQLELQKKEQQANDTIARHDTTIAFIDTSEGPISIPSVTDTTLSGQTTQNIDKSLRKRFGQFRDYARGQERFITIENELVKIVLTNKGGKIHSVELKNYRTYDSMPLILFEGEECKFFYQFAIAGNREIKTDDLYFEVAGNSFTVNGDSSASITFTLTTPEGSAIEQTYTLHGNSYLLDYDVALKGFDRIVPRNLNYMNLVWDYRMRLLEKSHKTSESYSALYYRYKDDDVENLKESGTDEEKLTTSFHWVSNKQPFFNATLIADESFYRGNVRSEVISDNPRYLKHTLTEIIFPFEHKNQHIYGMQWYFGPNHFQTLKKLDIGLEEIIPLGWGIFGWINKWIIIPIFNFLNKYISNYGLIIFILTLLVKIGLSPFTYKSYVSMAKMKALKPELDALREKYKDDQQKFATEQWKLFQQAGASPMGGCLPMLLQFPFLIAMYRFFPTSIELRQQSFLWADDLSSYDSIYDFPNGFEIPFYGDHISLFTLLMTASSLAYSISNQQMTGGSQSQMGQMKWMVYIFPIMLLPIFNNLPAALTYYYFLFTLLSFIQQYLFRKFLIDEEKIRQEILKRKSQPVKKTRFQKRLEELMKQQQQQAKKTSKKKR